jgi:hypothetical protein
MPIRCHCTHIPSVFLVLFKRTFSDKNIYIIYCDVIENVHICKQSLRICSGWYNKSRYPFFSKESGVVLRICVVGLEKGSELCRLLSKVGKCK